MIFGRFDCLARFGQLALTGCLTMAALGSGDAVAAPVSAVPVGVFLDSIGVVSTFPDRGQPLGQTIDMVRYCGFRWLRAGIEGLTDAGPTTIKTFLDLHRQTGVRLSWGLVSGSSDLTKLIATGKILAQNGALLAFEGNNEPNNWGITYQGQKGGGRSSSWLAVAMLQRDLYQSVKSDPILKEFPVWSVSEPGAEADNVGLQFLKIPAGAGTLMPDGTQYADVANVHNYVYHPHAPYPEDNKIWDAADPSPSSKVDGLYGNFGRTWRARYQGYTEKELMALPRVSTETGLSIGKNTNEEMHGRSLITLYLAQFKRGYSHTSVYLLRDRVDEQGNQAYGFYRPDYTPRKAAVYLHNLTTILADGGSARAGGALDYSLADQPATVHDLLLQKSDGTFALVLWDERLEGSDSVRLQLGASAASIKVFDPVSGTAVTEAHGNVKSLDLTLSDHPVILEITN